MVKRKQADTSESAAVRRDELAADVQRFLDAGQKIEQIPTGVSGQDPQGKGPQLRGNKPNNNKTAANTAVSTDGNATASAQPISADSQNEASSDIPDQATVVDVQVSAEDERSPVSAVETDAPAQTETSVQA